MAVVTTWHLMGKSRAEAQDGAGEGGWVGSGGLGSHLSFVRDFVPLGLLTETLVPRYQTLSPNFLPFFSVPVIHQVS